MIPTEAELSKAIESATAVTLIDLLAQHPEHFYYLTLTTTGEAHPPIFSAWSMEALEKLAAASDDPDDCRDMMKWSYADSPYCFFGESNFQLVRELFSQRPTLIHLSELDRSDEYELRLRAMETALKRLDSTGAFDKFGDRDSLFVNAEVVPPDYSNTIRGIRLNPPGAIAEWLLEYAEPDPML